MWNKGQAVDHHGASGDLPSASVAPIKPYSGCPKKTKATGKFLNWGN